jgi:hypothetical protein
VPKGGLEPPRSYDRQPLKLVEITDVSDLHCRGTVEPYANDPRQTKNPLSRTRAHMARSRTVLCTLPSLRDVKPVWMPTLGCEHETARCVRRGRSRRCSIQGSIRTTAAVSLTSVGGTVVEAFQSVRAVRARGHALAGSRPLCDKYLRALDRPFGNRPWETHASYLTMRPRAATGRC